MENWKFRTSFVKSRVPSEKYREKHENARRGGGRQARGKGERLCLLGGQEEEGTESQLERRRNFEVRWSHGEWEMVNDMICTIPDERAI